MGFPFFVFAGQLDPLDMEVGLLAAMERRLYPHNFSILLPFPEAEDFAASRSEVPEAGQMRSGRWPAKGDSPTRAIRAC
jgi:hypothetical protein